MRKSIPLLLVLLSLPLHAQTPYLVKDINTTFASNTASSSPSEFVAYRNRIFFTASTAGAGAELWSTDGTSAGTSMVADIIPGPASSNPNGFLVVNGALLFYASDVNHGTELWTTDGTAAGTHLLEDISPGPNSPGLIAAGSIGRVLYKNRMLFGADDGVNGRELWITDGTTGGTHLVKDINPGSGSSTPAYFATLGNSVYFSALGLWKTDGTESGTVKVSSVIPRNLVVAGSQLFFEGFTTAAGWEPWVSDGTDAGTHIVADIFPGTEGALNTNFSFFGFTPFGNRVLFLANDGVHGREMWISDGTGSGTRMVRDLVPGPTGMWDHSFAYITTLGDRAYFVASDDAHGSEVWVTDGTDSGTSLFADINPGPGASFPFNLVVSGGKLFVGAESVGGIRSGMFVTDGTVGGSHLVGPALDITRDLPHFWPIDGKLYFSGTDSLHGGEPWVTDGTDAGSRMIANLATDQAPSSSPAALTAGRSLLFFTALGETPQSSTVVGELWRSDGTESGTFNLTDGTQRLDGLTPAGSLLFYDDELFFPPKLMVSDGTREGTRPADDFMKRFGALQLGTLFPFGDTLFASMSENDFSGSVLWKTTAALNAPAVRLGSVNPFGMIEVAGHYLFYARAPIVTSDYGLWTTDGTPAGTHAIVPDLGDLSSNRPGPLANAEGTVFFLKSPRDAKTALWKSDGTLDGTTMVKEVSGTDTFRSEIKAVGRKVFFTAGGALWVSDGTESGTTELATTVNFPPEAADDHLRPVGNGVVFIQYDFPTSAYSLWSSDGTLEGTRLLRKLAQFQSEVSVIDGIAYFGGTDAEHGTEVWTTDGTVEGTKLLLDLNAGPASSDPAEFRKVGNLLYFSASTVATGRELWAMPLTAARLSIDDTRVTEGNSGTVVAHFDVSLSPAATQTVTVDYATANGTATAGQDYDSTSGRLTFAPGETTKSIDVVVHGDALPENNETFLVTLRNPVGAGVSRGEGVGIIDDDDQSSDLDVVAQFIESSGSYDDVVHVSNKGPSAAGDIIVKVTSTPDYEGPRCMTCPVPQLAPGASADASPDYWPPFTQAYLSATVTSRPADPNSSDNATSWTLNGGRSMVMTPAYLTVGQTATIFAQVGGRSSQVTSSDPSAVSAEQLVATPNGFGTIAIHALAPGSSTISIGGPEETLLIAVVAPGAQPKWPGGLTLRNDPPGTFDRPLLVTFTPSGTAPFSGATATGTVIVKAGQQELARRTISGTGTVSFPVYLPAVGPIAYSVEYGGDNTFLPQRLDNAIFVQKGATTIDAALQAVPSAPGTFALTVRVTGSPAAAPSGTLSILNGTVEIGRVELRAFSGETSVADTNLANLPAGATLTINYFGDSLYAPGSQQVRALESRRRAGRH